jgi:hypothetical protein
MAEYSMPAAFRIVERRQNQRLPELTFVEQIRDAFIALSAA